MFVPVLMYEYQYHMGLIILEKKEWKSKFEQAKASADVAENVFRRDQTAHVSALAEARKHEESLKRALAIEKECVANLEKALHEMRAESAETKLAYESKLAEAREMMEAAQKKFEMAEDKMHSAESLHAEASCCGSTALRNQQEVKAREDKLRRHLLSFQAELLLYAYTVPGNLQGKCCHGLIFGTTIYKYGIAKR